MIDSTQKLLK